MTQTTPASPEPRGQGKRIPRLREDVALRLLHTAREARGLLGDCARKSELTEKATELVKQLGQFLPPQSVCAVPESDRELRDLIDNAAWIAVMMRSHNWVQCGIPYTVIQDQAGQPVHQGERMAAETIDALGKAMLPGSSGIESWVGEIATEATRGDEYLSAVVKAAKYALHPTPLLIFSDTTRLLGEAVYAGNVAKLYGYVDRVREILAPKPPTVAEPAVRGPVLDAGMRDFRRGRGRSL
ncbi:hypothetical protein ABT040_28965 [Streptomyces sp. NPDC002688]|uniref:hypothetical protein n=1 Tax=Streptomyces sp. NPDC002688 TaxID=3154423 RepID=UPI00332C299D